MTIEAIMTVCTAIVTYIFGCLNKKFNLTDTNYIPLQNLSIGFLTGIIVFLSGLNDNLLSSIVICTVSALGAGGAYDLSKTGRDET